MTSFLPRALERVGAERRGQPPILARVTDVLAEGVDLSSGLLVGGKELEHVVGAALGDRIVQAVSLRARLDPLDVVPLVAFGAPPSTCARLSPAIAT
jgi:hypothetical protein